MLLRVRTAARSRFLPPRFFCAFLALPFLLVTPARSTVCVDYGTFIREVHTVPVSGTSFTADARGSALWGNYLFVANRGGFLDILNVAQPRQASIVRAQVVPSGNPLDVEVRAGVAYVLTETPTTIYAYDVTNPAFPVLLDSIQPPEMPDAFSLDGRPQPADSRPVPRTTTKELLAFAGEGMVRIYDVSNPSSIVARGTLDLADTIQDIDLVGDVLYVGGTELGVVDVSDPDTPFLALSATQLNLRAEALQVLGSTAYALGSAALHIVDVSDPLAPIIRSTTITGSNAFQGISVHGKIAYVANGNRSGVASWDVSDPTAPVQLGAAALTGNEVTAAAGFVYVTGGGGQVNILATGNPDSPSPIGAAPGVVTLDDMTVSGGYAYSVQTIVGLTVVDVVDPSSPAVVGSLAIPNANSVEVSGSVAVVGAWTPAPTSALHTVDVSDPANPSLITTVTTPGTVRALATDGALWYLADGTNGLQIVDLSDPATPLFLGSVSWGNFGATELALAGTEAYVVTGSYLRVVDISDPSAPVELASVVGPISSFPVVAASPPHVFVATNRELSVYDVTNPGAPQLLTALPIPANPKGLEVVGTVLYEASDFGVTPIDISDPASPVILGGAPTHGSAVAIRATVDYVYTGETSGGGVEIWPAQCGAAPAVVSAPAPDATFTLAAPAPNPFRTGSVISFALEAPGNASVAVYDVTGRHVRDLARRAFGEGRHSLSWDGRGADGRAVAGGVYFVRLEAGEEARLTKVVYLGR